MLSRFLRLVILIIILFSPISWLTVYASGGTLGQVEAQLRTLDHERVYVISQGGDVLAMRDGGSHTIWVADLCGIMNDAVLAHSHPAGNPALSEYDMAVAIRCNVRQMIAVARGGGVCVFVRPAVGWPSLDYAALKRETIHDFIQLDWHSADSVASLNITWNRLARVWGGSYSCG